MKKIILAFLLIQSISFYAMQQPARVSVRQSLQKGDLKSAIKKVLDNYIFTPIAIVSYKIIVAADPKKEGLKLNGCL